jgi:hypothetical protein
MSTSLSSSSDTGKVSSGSRSSGRGDGRNSDICSVRGGGSALRGVGGSGSGRGDVRGSDISSVRGDDRSV